MITIDGPSASGKGTLAQCIANWYDFTHLDSGLLYRNLAFSVLYNTQNTKGSPKCYYDRIESALEEMMKNVDVDSMQHLHNNHKLRLPKIGEKASALAQESCVRMSLLKWQRIFIQRNLANSRSLVIDGRDAGSVVWPDARYKFFVTASVAVRAQRRFLELVAQGVTTTIDSVTTALCARDKRDTERTHAPLIRPKDSILLDTTDAAENESFLCIRTIIEDKKLEI